MFFSSPHNIISLPRCHGVYSPSFDPKSLLFQPSWSVVTSIKALSTFNMLPPKILEKIINYLDSKNLVSLSEANQEFAGIAKERIVGMKNMMGVRSARRGMRIFGR